MLYKQIINHIKTCDQLVIHFGIEPEECRPGYGKATMPLDARHLNGVGTAHGGVIFTLADIALALSALSHGNLALTLNLDISYLKPGRIGPLVAESREISSSGRISHFEVEVRDAEGSMVAHCKGMAYHKTDLLLPDCWEKME